MNLPRLTDTTLRDGSHAMRHQFTRQQVRNVVQVLDQAGVPIIEVSHGDGLAGSSIQYGMSLVDEMELIEEACAVAKSAKIAALLLPGIGTHKELSEAASRGIQVIRIATHCTEADISEQHFAMAKERGLEADGLMILAHMRPPEVLVEQARLMESYGADCVYIMDSAGAMLPEDVKTRVSALKQALKIQVGFHGHNNLGLAMGNTLAAIDAGADQVDGTLRGLGGGAGNAATELIAAALDKRGMNPGLDVFGLFNAAEFTLAPMIPFQPFPDRDSAAIGYAGVYSSFLLHAKRVGAEYGVDPLDIIVELGRRNAIGGQEDWILDVALELQRKHAETNLA